AFPMGSRIHVGANRPRTCTSKEVAGSCFGVWTDCAVGVEDDCCLFLDEGTSHPWQTHLWFDVVGEPSDAVASAESDGGVPRPHSSDAAVDAGVGGPEEPPPDDEFGVPLSDDLTDDEHSDRQEMAFPTAVAYALRCSVGSGDAPVDIYLDLGPDLLNGDIVEISVAATTTAEQLDVATEHQLSWE